MRSQRFDAGIRSRRKVLLTSVAGLCLAVAGTAQAQDAPAPGPTFSVADAAQPATAAPEFSLDLPESAAKGRPDFAINVAQSASSARDFAVNVPRSTTRHPDFAVNVPRSTTRLPDDAINEPHIVVEGPGTGFTSDNVVDTTNITGVGQMVIETSRTEGPNGTSVGLGLCTGTLINPRTVIFAAHCVNEGNEGGFQDADAYGSHGDGIPIGFGFQADNLAAAREWLFGIESGTPHQTSEENYFYNVNQVKYNPDSTLLGPANNFLQGDVALASFDTPVTNVPTWALLLSKLPQVETLGDLNGSGYHVNLIGYGRNGVGQTGDTNGIDFRRRVVENVIGILGSLDDRDQFLFGSPDGLPQNLYQIDFDSPDFASPFDFDIFQGREIEREGGTAGGDSGGPLVLDQEYAEKLVLGVLSGGTPAYFPGQPSNSYGSTSFYQPLYLFSDYIIANNPYRYTKNVAGDGNWSDPDHWVTALDPAYRIIDDNGEAVNGVPDTPSAGIDGDSPDDKFGTICAVFAGAGGGADYRCRDLATNNETVNGEPVVTDEDPQPQGNGDGHPQIASVSNDKGIGTLSDIRGGNVASSAGTGTVTTAADGDGMADDAPTLPDPTLENGRVGATGYVPNNQDPVRPGEIAGVEARDARYFDVTLSEPGTTTLGTDITIDRFTVSGTTAALDIAGNGSLTSLIDITQTAGLINVDGTLDSNGDFFMLAGMLTGSGAISTPFFTSAAGNIAPGKVGTTGTLTFNGNAILSSRTAYLVDLGSAGASDLLAVAATRFDADDMPQDGIASLGGAIGFAVASGEMPREGDSFTVLTAEGGIDGTFDGVTPLSAILTPEISYTDNAVTVTLEAGSYASVVDRGAQVQTSFATLLDANRSQYDRFSDLYGNLDLLGVDAVRSTLDSFAPRDVTLGGVLGTVAVETTNRFFRQRLRRMNSSDLGGTIATYGKPAQLASVAIANPVSASPLGAGGAADPRANSQPAIQEGALPEDMSAFFAASYIEGDSAGMRTARPNARDNFEGYFLSGGLEKTLGAASTIGVAFSYSELDGETGGPGQSADAGLYQGTIYGRADLGSGASFDAQLSAGKLDTSHLRDISLGSTAYTITGGDDSFTLSGEVGVSNKVTPVSGLDLTPRASIRFARIDFDDVTEDGGGPALQYRLNDYDSFQGRLGATASGHLGALATTFLTGNYVHEFKDRPGAFLANFVGGAGQPVPFALNATDKNWAELSGGVTLRRDNFEFSAAIETSIWRKDIDNRTYRATAAFHF